MKGFSSDFDNEIEIDLSVYFILRVGNFFCFVLLYEFF